MCESVCTGVPGPRSNLEPIVRFQKRQFHIHAGSFFWTLFHMIASQTLSPGPPRDPLALVCGNAIYLGFDVGYNKADMIYDADAIFQVMENFFTCCFSVADLHIHKYLRKSFYIAVPRESPGVVSVRIDMFKSAQTSIQSPTYFCAPSQRSVFDDSVS